MTSARPFELRTVARKERRRGSGDYGLALYQHRHGLHGPETDGHGLPLCRIWGMPFRASVDRIFAALKDNGYRASDLARTRRAPFVLAEESGVRLALLFLAVKVLKRPSRIEAIGDGIWAMGSEEAYYWFSKCTDPRIGRRAQQALRVLFSEG